MKLDIRKFNENDLDTVIEIDKNFPPKARKILTKEAALELYEKNENACLVAEDVEKIVGAIFGEIQGKTYIIKFLIIHPEYLGEGIATLLIEKVIKKTNANSVEKF